MGTLPLTNKETEVYDFITAYIKKNSYSPTYREIQDNLGYNNIGTVQAAVQQLIKKSYLYNTGKIRGIVPVEDDGPRASLVPLSGYVAAGAPIEAIENTEYIEVPQTMIKQGQNYFALIVKGDSMIDDHIMDGDFVVIKKQKTANENQIVVAVIDNNATLKRYKKTKGVIELHPANANYKPIRVKEDSNFEILGVLAGVIRSYK